VLQSLTRCVKKWASGKVDHAVVMHLYQNKLLRKIKNS
jgi:hypothetical protein